MKKKPFYCSHTPLWIQCVCQLKISKSHWTFFSRRIARTKENSTGNRNINTFPLLNLNNIPGCVCVCVSPETKTILHRFPLDINSYVQRCKAYNKSSFSYRVLYIIHSLHIEEKTNSIPFHVSQQEIDKLVVRIATLIVYMNNNGAQYNT